MTRGGLALQFSSSTDFKMKSLVLLLATVALASATFIGGKYHIDIKEDGTVFIKSEDGKQIYISNQFGPHGMKTFEIGMTGPDNFSKMYRFDSYNEVNTLNGNNQEQYIFDVIFREYQGYIDEYTYQQLLNKVHKAVLNGFVDSRVYYILQTLTEDSKWTGLVSGDSFYRQYSGLFNKMPLVNKYGLTKMFKEQGFYGQNFNQYNVDYFYNVLMKIFDKQTIETILYQQKMFNQELYGQYSYEKMWDMIFAHEGIFDHQYLMRIVNNEELRNYFIQQGFFDVAVLKQILVAYKSEGVYNQYLLDGLVNRQVLKDFFLNRKTSVYDIMGQTSYNQYYDNTYYNKDYYGYNILKTILTQPMWRNVLVQYGIFNKNVLDQILYRYNTHGVFDEVLLKQLVNKQLLYTFLTQYGVVDENILRQYVDNEYMGLTYLFKNNFFQQTPKLSYKQLFGMYGNVPEYKNYMQMYGGNFLKNMLYGQRYYGFNQEPYSSGKVYQQYPVSQRVY